MGPQVSLRRLFPENCAKVCTKSSLAESLLSATATELVLLVPEKQKDVLSLCELDRPGSLQLQITCVSLISLGGHTCMLPL